MPKKVKEEKTNKEADMMTAAFDYWFSDNGHVRSPFPFYIHEELREKAISKFLSWTQQIPIKAKKEINDEIVAEKFEEILFETALKLVITEDEKLTIRYPFLMRIGDAIKVRGVDEKIAESKAIDRWFFKKGDEAFMKVKLKNTVTGEEWETDFELPE